MNESERIYKAGSRIMNAALEFAKKHGGESPARFADALERVAAFLELR